MSDFISKSRLKWEIEKWYDKEYYSSFNAAVYNALLKIIDKFPSVEPEKCGDCISRQAVIDRINKLIEVEKKQGTDDWGYGRERVNAYESMLHFVKSEYLHPSVEPERPRGKWIRVIDPDVNAWTGGHTCSECGRACVQMSMDYCANCGAKMKGEHT